MNVTTKSLTMLLLLALGAFALTGCSDDDENPMTPDMGSGAMLRVVHASPDAPAVDIYAEGVSAPLLTDVSYTETSAWLDLAAGTYNIQLRAAGADPASAPAYETGDLTVPAGATITALAVGLLGSTDADARFRVIPLVEDWQDPGSGNAAVRLVHGSADAPAVAIDVGNDGTPEISGFARFADSGADGVPLPAGAALDVGIWAGSPLSRVTAFRTPALPEANIILVATGLVGERPRDADGFGLLAVGPAGTIGLIRQNPSVFVLHGSPDAPAVDVFVSGTDVELIDALAFGELSAPVQVAPGSYALDVKVAAGGATAATITTPELMAGERYLVVASGFVGGSQPGFTVLPLAEQFADDMDARVRVVHASPDAPAVDVGVVTADKAFTPLAPFSDLAFGAASEATGLSVGPAALTLGVAATGTIDPVATFDVTLSAGQQAFAVAAGSLTGTGEGFRLMLVDTTGFPWVTASVLPNGMN
ncbi:DUF4397 domain-containing protein [bacterium]|nr:DUF4397 domain-containing protein [bacterium]